MRKPKRATRQQHFGHLNPSHFEFVSNSKFRPSALPVSSDSGREKPAKSTVECCDYTYWTEVKHASGGVADYLVIGTLLLYAEGNPIRECNDRISSAIWSERVENTPLGTARCSGWLNTFFVTETEVASIRHIIVVHPREVNVPFVLTDLPLTIL